MNYISSVIGITNLKSYETPEYIQKNWDIVSDSESVFHQIGAPNNKKYISPDGGYREVVINEYGGIVTNPINMGTFNFSPNPISPLGHGAYDVYQYYLFGNTKVGSDASPFQRGWATIRSIFIKIGLDW